MGFEGAEWSWDFLWTDKHAVEHGGMIFRLDQITAECSVHWRVALLPAREVGLGKLRPLPADGCIDGEQNATVCLLEVQ